MIDAYLTLYDKTILCFKQKKIVFMFQKKLIISKCYCSSVQNHLNKKKTQTKHNGLALDRKNYTFWGIQKACLTALLTLILCMITLQWVENTQELHFSLNLPFICSHSRTHHLFSELLKHNSVSATMEKVSQWCNI